MFTRFIFPAVVLALVFAGSAHGQHSDVEFGYDSINSPGAFEVEFPALTSEGFGIYESALEVLDPGAPGNFSADEPGFMTNDAEGLLINQGDQIFLNVLDASTESSFGVGYVNYYNPLTDSLESTGRFAVIDNTVGTNDLVLNGGSIESGPNQQFLGAGDVDGDLHDHLVFDLLDDSTAPLGAYGFLVQLQSDLAPTDGTLDFNSDPFWIVLNHGLSDDDFDELALPRFGAVESIPEPGSLALLCFTGGLLATGRRRKQ